MDEKNEINQVKKYPALEIISISFFVLGLLIIFIYVIIGFRLLNYIYGLFPDLNEVTIFFIIIVIGFASALPFFAVSEVIKVFINIEENTRYSLQLIQKNGKDKAVPKRPPDTHQVSIRRR